jgi:hypothetical protein
MATTQAEAESVSVDERRAQWESYSFRVPAEGRVLVENHSHEDSSEHRYVVSVEAGEPRSCTCPHWEHRRPAGGCKHIRATRNVEAVIQAASTERDE